MKEDQGLGERTSFINGVAIEAYFRERCLSQDLNHKRSQPCEEQSNVEKFGDEGIKGLEFGEREGAYQVRTWHKISVYSEH